MIALRLLLGLTLVAGVGCQTWRADEVPDDVRPTFAIPRRTETALSGSAFGQKTQALAAQKREDAILAELRRGNVPSFLRSLKPVRVETKIGGRTVEAQYWVMPDYLAIGSDDDYLYIPMTPLTAQKVADHYGFVLPTRKMVDDIYRASRVKLEPQPLKPGPQMASTGYYTQHNAVLVKQLQSLARPRDALVAGHKKDIVLTNRLCKQKRRVAIYGWHRSSGKPIQPLSLVHGETYADYSHGVRLVAGMMLVDGHLRPVAEVLEDPTWAPLLSDEGALRQTRIATDCYSC